MFVHTSTFTNRIPISILKFLYPQHEPNHKRDRPMRVLCLGMGRTGTVSLDHALGELGYDGVYSGWTIAESASTCPQWHRLELARSHGDASSVDTEEFDKILGNCSAVVDVPGCHWGIELLRAYPDAKVILNRRKDVDSWLVSQLATVSAMFTTWPEWLQTWFETDLFWIHNLHMWSQQVPYGFDIEKNGKKVYAEHYRALEDECRRQGREWLDWHVEEGWEPLCKFLDDKPVPDAPFPNENAKGGFALKALEYQARRFARADRNMRIAAGVVASAIAAGVYFSL